MTREPTRSLGAAGASRPRNRRALILAAATRLFHARGYDQVSMGDLAAAAGIGPSALYRHFSGKQHLLGEVIGSEIAGVSDALVYVDFRDPRAANRQLAAMAIENRHLGLLWERESRHLARHDQIRARAEIRGFGRTLSRPMLASRTDLMPEQAEVLGWAAIGVLSSLSFHHLTMPDDELEVLVSELFGQVLAAELPPDALTRSVEVRGPSQPLQHRSRREALLAVSVGMFARAGYSQVGIEDLGAAVGIAGPSVYNHFASKEEMLWTALSRGIAHLYNDLAAILRGADDPGAALVGLVDSYMRFSREHTDLLELLISEPRQLSGEDRRVLNQAVRDYVTEWVHLLQQVEPGLDATAARVRVHAVLTVINDLYRMPRQRALAGLDDVIRAVCLTLLSTATPRTRVSVEALSQ